MTIRVLVADDHPIVRSGICKELGRHHDIEVIGEAVNGDEALHLTDVLQPDVLLLDINMPGLKAAQVVRELQSEPRSPRILILTAYKDREDVLGMLKAGVTGYLLKDEDPLIIVEGVRLVAQGKTWLSSEVTKSLAQYATSEEHAQYAALSERELDVLRLLAQGDSNQQIADKLSISEGTVKNHVTKIYDKLEVHTRAEATAWDWRQGLLHGT